MQLDRFTVRADTPVLAQPPVNVVDFGAVGDGSHNDGPAFQGAANFAATSGRKTIVIPSSPAGYSIATTVSVAKPGQWGLRWVGEGGRPIGPLNSTSTLWCDVQEKHGSKASIGEVGFVGSGGTYYTVRVDGLEGQLTDADVGKFLRLVGSAKNGNDGRFMIVKRLDDSSCLIFKPLPQNTQPVADDPNKDQIDWRVEECAFDVRARENIFEHLTFMVRPGQTITRMVNVTESPEPDSNVTGHVKFTDCYFTSGLISGANARWGVTLAELFLPKREKTEVYKEELGVPRPAMPTNCDFISFLDCGFDGLQEAGVAHCNTSAGRTGGGGQSREHLFFRCEFAHMPFGYYTLPGSFGMARFEQCNWDTISDTGVVLRNGVNVLTISGGVTEECARLVDYSGTGGAPNPVVIEDISFSLSHSFVHPSNEIMTFGGLGPFLFKNVLINTPDAATPFISLTAPAGSGEGLLTVMSCQFSGDQHSPRPGGHGRLWAPRQGPFPLAEGMTLVIKSSFNGSLETVTFHNGTRPDQTPFFVNGIARATAKEVAAVINTQLTLNKVRAFGTGDNLLALESTTPGDTDDALFLVFTPPSGGPPGGSAYTVFDFTPDPTNENYTVGWPQSDLAKFTGGFFDTDRGNPERRVVLIGNGQFHSSPLPARPDPFEDGIFHLGGTGRTPQGFSTRNLSGSVQITHPQTSARVQFTRAELDAAYLPTVSAGPSVGTPAPGALRTSWANRTPDGFDINLEAPPGSGQTTPNVVQVIWHLLR